MIIKKSFLFLLVLFTLFSSCKAASIDEVLPKNNAAEARSWSLVAPKDKSIMSALFMSWFSIPTVRRSIILEAFNCSRIEKPNEENVAERTKQVFTSYLAGKLKELIVKKGPVAIEPKFLVRYTSTSLAEAPLLWNEFHGAFVAPLQKGFVFSFDVSVTKPSGQVSGTKCLSKCVRVYLDGVYSSLGDLIANDFYSEQSNRRFQEKFALKTELSVRYNFSVFPEVLVFEFKRFVLEDSFLDRLFQLQKELTIGGHVYRMASRLEFDAKEKTFSCVALDFERGLEYLYDHDGKITALESPGDVINDTKSIFAFYSKVPAAPETREQSVQTSLTAKVETTEHLNQQQQDHQEQEPRGVKRNADEVVDLTTSEFDDEQLDLKWSLVYRPDVSRIPQLLREKYITIIEARLKSKIREWPLEFMNLYSKLITKTYLLGSESYSFKPGLYDRPYGALEIFLSSIAANEKAVNDLFDAFEGGQQTEIQQMITVVILKMLLGCKNIPLDKLAQWFLIKQNVFLGLISTNDRNDVDFRTKFMQILGIFGRKDLFGVPLMKTEQYVDLDSDDPQKVILDVHTSTAVKPASIIPPRERAIKGLWYDYCNSMKSVRRRNIYKSNSEMFVIEVDRMVHVDKKIVFDAAELSLNEGEYECIGVVSSINTGQENIILFNALNSFQNNLTYRSFSPGVGAKIFEASETNTKYFNDLKKYNSIMLIYTKKGVKTASRPMYTGLIQNNLIKAAFRDYAEETGVKLK